MPNLIQEVLTGKRRWWVETGEAIAWMARLPENCCSLVFFSPPYEDARTYGEGVGFKLKGEEWVLWMREIVCACARISSGLVVVNMSGRVRDRSYSLVPEKLAVDLSRLDGLICWPSPYAWIKMEDRDDALPNGIPGSGGKDCQRRDWEPVYCFSKPGSLPLPYTDNTAFGPRTADTSYGGEFSNRSQDGTRANEYQEAQKALPTFQNGKDGTVKGGHRRVRPEVSNPGNVIRVPVGGGKLGHPLAHESHAPMPLGLAERFVRWFAAPDSVVCDPFVGSGTTIEAALKHGRRGIGCDIWSGKGGIDTAIRRLKGCRRSDKVGL